MNMHTLKLTVLLAAVAAGRLVSAPEPAQARAAQVFTRPFSSLALGGYDPVAYFDQGKPVRGLPQYSLVWKGAEHRFASPEHLARFRADPESFAPQFGGYCAWAVARGYLAKGDPQAWSLVGGKLYLNYDAAVKARWETDIPGHIARARQNWPRVLR